jgi:hypothetical protein
VTKPTPWDYIEGYTLAVIAGIGFWTWVGIETAAGLVRKAVEQESPK